MPQSCTASKEVHVPSLDTLNPIQPSLNFTEKQVYLTLRYRML